MKLPRRQFLHLAAGATALAAVSRFAWAQDYPTRPVRLIVGFASGSPADLVARLIAQWLSERLGQPFLVEIRTGAGSNIAAEAVVNAPPDGYTLLQVTLSNAWNASLYDNLDFTREIAPVATIIRQPQVMLVHPSFPAATVPEFVAYAKANPGKLKMASAGNGTSGHVTGELFNMMTGLKMVHVPYGGAPPALADLVGGQVQVMFLGSVALFDYIKTGKLRALAVTTATRLDALPDIPTVGSFVPGYESSNWFGIGAPKNTPIEVIAKLNKEINAGLGDPKTMAQLADLGGVVLAGSPGDFGKLIAEETEKWAKVVKFSGAKPG